MREVEVRARGSPFGAERRAPGWMQLAMWMHARVAAWVWACGAVLVA